MTRAKPRHYRDRQSPGEDRGQAEPSRVSAERPGEIEPERIQEVIIVVRNAPEDLPEVLDGPEVDQRPDFVVAERPMRGDEPDDHADRGQGRDRRRERPAPDEPGPSF